MGGPFVLLSGRKRLPARAYRPDWGAGFIYFTVTSFSSTSTMVSMSCTATHSLRPWPFMPPVDRFGQGSPIKDSRQPSVPPRTGTV